jgi:hypothetical protein
MTAAAPRSAIKTATAPCNASASLSAVPIWSPPVLLQAKCACGAPTTASGQSCAACAAEGESQIQPATVPGHEFAHLRVQPAGGPGGAVLGRPGDPLELEADRIADRVVQRLATTATVDAPPVVTPATAATSLQRQADPDEDAADSAAENALTGPELESAPPGDDSDSDEGNDKEGDDTVQAKSDGGDVGSTLSAAFRGQVAVARGAGASLPPGLRAGVEAAFGADFGAVRIHADARADALARSIHALAFTTGRDIFFAAGRYNTQSESGRRLLAHELTHVLQQGAVPGRAQAFVSRATVDSVQRAPAPDEPQLIGRFYYFDAKGDVVVEAPVSAVVDLGIPPGYFEVKVKATPGAKEYKITVVGVKDFSVTTTNPKYLTEVLSKTKRVFLLVYNKAGTDKPDKAKPSADDPTGAAGKPPPDAPPPEGPAGDKPPAQQGEPTESKKPPSEGKGDPDSGGTKDSPKETPGGTEQDPDKAGGGLPGKKKGSKFGVFGLLDLPQPLVDVLEGALEVLGDSAEMEAMSESLRMLKELAEHRDALGDLFKDTDALLEIALGLKDNAAINAIEAWALRDVKPAKASRAKHKGVARLAAKLVATVGKLRKILKPVFKLRAAVQSAIGGVGLLLEAAPALEALLDMAADPSKIGEIDLQSAADDFAVDFAAQLREKLDSAPKALKAGIEKLSEADLVGYEELAAAVTAAVLAALPKHYKPIVKVGKALGIDRAISDNVIAPLIPKAALDGVNDVLRSLVKLVQPTLEGAADDLQKIVDDLAVGFLAELPAEVKKLIKPSRRPGRAARRSSAMALARGIGRSQGEPLAEPARSDAETRMGHSFAHVRVHTDFAANNAADSLHANAFAIGSNLYFARGAFDTEREGGRRLLYHELAHSMQQEARGGVALQPDYKDLLARLAKRFSATVIAELKGATASSPAKQKQATEIRDKVTKLIGREVKSRTDAPKLPTGYMYIPKNKGKIKTIRRALAWIRFIPALTIDRKRIIRLAATLSKFDPKAAARRALRAALGCTGKQEAHHIIPLELMLDPVVKTAIKNGFNFNGRDNGLCISDRIHSGSHRIYTADVRRRLATLQISFGTDWTKLQNPFESMIENLRAELKKRRKKLS